MHMALAIFFSLYLRTKNFLIVRGVLFREAVSSLLRVTKPVAVAK